MKWFWSDLISSAVPPAVISSDVGLIPTRVWRRVAANNCVPPHPIIVVRVKTQPELERWFASKNHPNEKAIRLREIILGADKRLTASLKYGTLTFAYEGDSRPSCS